MKMLKCFGKGSSKTYIVNKTPYKDIDRNGVAPVPIVPVTPEPEPVPPDEKLTKTDLKKIAPAPPQATKEQIKYNGNNVEVEATSIQPSKQPPESIEQDQIYDKIGNTHFQSQETYPKKSFGQENTNDKISDTGLKTETKITTESNVTRITANKADVAKQSETKAIKEYTITELEEAKDNSDTKNKISDNGETKIITKITDNKSNAAKQSNVTVAINAEKNTIKEDTISELQGTKINNEKSDDGSKTETKITTKTNVTKITDNRANVRKQNNIKVLTNVEKNNAIKEDTISESEETMDDSEADDDESEGNNNVNGTVTKIKSIQKKNKGGGKKVRIENGGNALSGIKKDAGKKKDAEEVDTSSMKPEKRRSGITPLPVNYDKTNAALPNYPKDPDDELLIKKAIESNDFLRKIISDKRLDDVVRCMYNKEISAKETIVKQGEKGSHMYVSAKGKYQVLVNRKVVATFEDVRVFGELAILYNAQRLATIKAVTSGRVWVLDRDVFQQIMVQYNIKEQDEIMTFLMNNKKLNVVGKAALQEVANLLKSEFFSAGKQIVRQGDKGHQFYIIRAGTVTITKDGEGVVGNYKRGDCFGELALLKEDCRQATVTANAPGVECLTLTRKEFIDHFGELKDITEIKARPQDSIQAVVVEHEDINLMDLKIIKTLGVGGFGRVELVQHSKKKDLVFALKYLKKIDIVLQHQQEHVYNEKNIQMASNSAFIVRLYRTYKDSKYIYLLMESCLGGDLWSLLQRQRLRRFEEKEARFISACVLEAFDYLHSRGIIYRDLKPENLLIAATGYIKLTDFGFAKKISSRGRTFTFAGTPEYVAPEIVLNKGHDRAVDYWAFGAFIFEMLTGRTPFRTDDSSHMKTYNKILNGIDNIQFPSYVNLKARHIIEKLCRPVPSERLGMQRGGIKDIKNHKWFLGFDWQKFGKCEIPSPFKPKLKNQIDTQHFDPFKQDTDIPPDEMSGWDEHF